MIDWDGIYSHLIASFGWTWDYIDNSLTLIQLTAINSYQAKHPAIQTMIQTYLGIEPKEREQQPEEKMSFGDFLQTIQG